MVNSNAVGSTGRKISITSWCFSAKHAGVRAKTGWLGIRIICLSGMTYLSTDYWFSELAP